VAKVNDLKEEEREIFAERKREKEGVNKCREYSLSLCDVY
jgi:hypothetical protein